ncbi:hypothetical protein ASPBRDRAFT_50453 [Aspergillus brasiliensis CBS 101740]|uniref:Uncharacterized protein n=1 Tax=Aspergillus brasiliensis (strain CBS 101740 / IMI 381727 / IBT 21946) TaxID=767769 RepID=A0A1L9V181_ASPBC|nr:hypothetical protein ASPBRDRAFT_50453 [Aspergillus brasiliensis CBS 101740]
MSSNYSARSDLVTADGRIGGRSRDHALPVASSGVGRLGGSTVHHDCFCLQMQPEWKVINNGSSAGLITNLGYFPVGVVREGRESPPCDITTCFPQSTRFQADLGKATPDADARSADVSGLPGRQITAHVMAAQVTEKPVNIPPTPPKDPSQCVSIHPFSIKAEPTVTLAILIQIVLGASAIPGA